MVFPALSSDIETCSCGYTTFNLDGNFGADELMEYQGSINHGGQQEKVSTVIDPYDKKIVIGCVCRRDTQLAKWITGHAGPIAELIAQKSKHKITEAEYLIDASLSIEQALVGCRGEVHFAHDETAVDREDDESEDYCEFIDTGAC